MHALYLVIPALCIMAIAYRYYSAFIAAKVMALDDSRSHAGAHEVRRRTTTTRRTGGCSSAITSRRSPAPGRWSGRSLAAQFGYAPGFIWLVGGVLPRRRGARLDRRCGPRPGAAAGRSAEIARTEIGPVAGTTGAIAILFIVDHRAGRPRHRRRQRAGRKRLGRRSRSA